MYKQAAPIEIYAKKERKVKWNMQSKTARERERERLITYFKCLVNHDS